MIRVGNRAMEAEPPEDSGAMGMRVRNATRDCMLGDRVRQAFSLFSRMRGLLGTRALSPGEGLWICPCNSIHSMGMAFEFDALFLDRGMRVVALHQRFRKNRLSRIYWDARGVLELPEGTIERTGTEVGDEIEFRE